MSCGRYVAVFLSDNIRRNRQNRRSLAEGAFFVKDGTDEVVYAGIDEVIAVFVFGAIGYGVPFNWAYYYRMNIDLM